MTPQEALAEKLKEDAFVSLSHVEAAAAINAVMVDEIVPIKAADIKNKWSRWMVIAKCAVLARDPAAPLDARVVCQATYDNLTMDVFQDLDPREEDQAAEIKAYLDALVACGALTEQQRVDTLALANVRKPWAETVGWHREIDFGDVLAARGGRWEDHAIPNPLEPAEEVVNG